MVLRRDSRRWGIGLRAGRGGDGANWGLAVGVLPGSSARPGVDSLLLIHERTATRPDRRCGRFRPKPGSFGGLPDFGAYAFLRAELPGHGCHEFRDRRPGLLGAGVS